MQCCCAEVSPEVETIPKSLVKQVPTDTPVPEDAKGRTPVENEVEFDAVVTRTEQESKVGLDITHSRNGRYLRIKKIKDDGLVQKWNDEHPTMMVKEMDRIVSVNGVYGLAEELLQLISSQRVLTFRINRIASDQAAEQDLKSS